MRTLKLTGKDVVYYISEDNSYGNRILCKDFAARFFGIFSKNVLLTIRATKKEGFIPIKIVRNDEYKRLEWWDNEHHFSRYMFPDLAEFISANFKVPGKIYVKVEAI